MRSCILFSQIRTCRNSDNIRFVMNVLTMHIRSVFCFPLECSFSEETSEPEY